MNKLIVFDLDGTLLETAPDLISALNFVLGENGVEPLSMEVGRQYIGKGAAFLIQEGYRYRGHPLPEDQLSDLVVAFIDYYERNIVAKTYPFPGVLDALAKLESAGWKFAVCTNKLESLAKKIFDELNLSDRFEIVTGGDTFPFKKPDPRHLIQTIEMSGGTIATSIMVGDSISDIDAAKTAGVPVIAVDFGYTPIPVTELGPDTIISHFDQLPEAVSYLTPAWA